MRNPEGDPPSKRARKRFVQQEELSDCYISVRPINVKMSVSVQSAFNREESVRSNDLMLQVSNETIPARCVSKAVSFYLNLLLGSTGGAR